jgi:hypothetical protein
MKISLKFVVSYPTLEPLLEPLFKYFDHGIFPFLPLLKCGLLQVRFLFSIKLGSHMNLSVG